MTKNTRTPLRRCDGTCDTCPTACFVGAVIERGDEPHDTHCVCVACLDKHPERRDWLHDLYYDEDEDGVGDEDL